MMELALTGHTAIPVAKSDRGWTGVMASVWTAACHAYARGSAVELAA